MPRVQASLPLIFHDSGDEHPIRGTKCANQATNFYAFSIRCNRNHAHYVSDRSLDPDLVL